MKLTQEESNKLDNTCGNLRVTKLGTHIKALEDFVNQNTLETNANTVVEAINELYRMIVNKDCSSIQVPPPGFFTLWGNDEDGKLYCYYNDEDHPPVFHHVEDENADDFGTLYLYIADPEGENHYELKIGEYIAVKHLNDYYKKSEITTLLDSKSNTQHKHTKADITDFPSKVSAFTNDAGYLTKHQNIDNLATIEYVDNQIASIDDDVEIDLASKADKVHTHKKSDITDFPTTMTPSSHKHGNITNDGKIGSTKGLPVITGANGVLTTAAYDLNEYKMYGSEISQNENSKFCAYVTHLNQFVKIISIIVNGAKYGGGTLFTLDSMYCPTNKVEWAAHSYSGDDTTIIITTDGKVSLDTTIGTNDLLCATFIYL